VARFTKQNRAAGLPTRRAKQEVALKR